LEVNFKAVGKGTAPGFQSLGTRPLSTAVQPACHRCHGW